MAKVSLTYCKGKNFGDRLNVFLAEGLGIDTLRHNTRDRIEDDVSVLGIGTILNDRLQLGEQTRLVVFGSGYGYPDKRLRVPGKIDLRFLRGPLSCQVLGVPAKYAIADAGYLFRDEFRRLAADVERSEPVGYLPHHASLELRLPLWREPWLAERSIDPTTSPRDYVRRVAACRHVVTECLHGAILADCLEIPFTVVQTATTFDSFKWLDWAAAFGRELRLSFLSAETAPSLPQRALAPIDQRQLQAAVSRIGDACARLKAEVAELNGKGGVSEA